MHVLLKPIAVLSLLFSGAVFGFFYAWVCSTLWGLDIADPNVAIVAMQAMNANVRNWVFAPAFFGTPVVLAATALVAWVSAERRAALLFAAGGVLYLVGGMILTITVHVPMNEALALVEAPLDAARAQETWQAYSVPWQRWNIVRAVASGLALLLTGLGVLGCASSNGMTELTKYAGTCTDLSTVQELQDTRRRN